MYLKSLTLKGFKSFADRTHMVFDPGLTVVVGPNGSGKSNVSDAILWVLGEQSAKMLRGQAMEDVIFSGSTNRSPVGVAEVTLVLDNNDQTIPVEFREVAVTRRMYRSGESEYLINGSPARLMDIQDILHDSGLGKDTHSIISQGKLDSVLSSKPEQRRQLIEEAAGISKHRRRKERSLRKLNSMEENLVRVKDISRVINRQLRPLERQVDKAQRHADIQKQLSEASIILSVDNLRQLQLQWNRINDKIREQEAAVELAQYRVGEKKKELNKLQSMLEQKGLFVGDLGEQRRRMQDMVGRIDSDMRLLEEKGKNMVEKLSDLRRNISQLENQMRQAREELTLCDNEVIDASKTSENLSSQVSELGPQASLAREQKAKLDKTFQELTSQIREQQKISDQETLLFARLKETISNAEVEDSMFASRLEALNDSKELCNQSLKHNAEQKSNLDSEINQLETGLNELQKSLDEIRTQMKIVASQEDDALKELSHARAQLSALLSVDAASQDTNPLIKSLASDAGFKHAIQARISDIFEAQPEYEKLVEEVLGEALNALVVSNDSDIESMAEYFETKQLKGSAQVISKAQQSVLDIDVLTQSGIQARPLSSVVVAHDGYKALIDSILGSYVLVEDIPTAIKAHKVYPFATYITRQSERLMPDGTCVLGTGEAPAKGALERKRTIRNLESSIPKLEQQHEDLKNEQKLLNDKLNNLRDEQDKARGELARSKGSLGSLVRELGRLESELASTEREIEQVASKRSEVAQKAQSAKEELDSHKTRAQEAEKLVEEFSLKLNDVNQQRDEAIVREREMSSKLNDLRLDLAKVTERLTHQQTRQADLKHQLEVLTQKHTSINESAMALDILRLRIDPLHEVYSEIQQSAWAWAARLQDRASLAEADSHSLKKTIEEARREVGKAHGELDRAQQEVAESRIVTGKLEVQVEQAIQEITREGTYTLEDALGLPAPEDKEKLIHDIEKFKRQLEDIGPVNQVAMDEYTKLKEKADYIAVQVEDLEQARKSMLKITQAIDRKMKKQFLLTFEEVNNNFQEIFAMLFPGGHAELEMLDPENPSETGIEIIAQPKGKKITKMMLMSGGEKSLTALALLFAVYRTRTVPFYVFDEVEAALDASNLDKLLTAIEQLKETTQLIVISHQRRTMEQADVLYGVSMQADGVSHVVSQRIEKSA